MAHKVSLEILGVIENMSGFTTPTGERYAIFGEGGGQELADELDVPLLGKVPLTMPLREHADAGVPLVLEDPDDPAAQAIRQAARGLIAMAPLELPVLESPPRPPSPSPTASSRQPRARSLRVCRCRWPDSSACFQALRLAARPLDPQNTSNCRQVAAHSRRAWSLRRERSRESP